jgi:serine protease
MKFARLSLIPALLCAACFEIEPPPPPPIGSTIEGDLRVTGVTAASAANSASARTRVAISRAFQGAEARLDDLGPDGASALNPTSHVPPPREFPARKLEWLPGQLLIQTEYRQADRAALQSQLTRDLQRAAIPVELRVDICSARTLCRAHAFDLEGKPLASEPTFELAQRLHDERLDGVRTVSVNGIKYAQRVPNDEHFDLQWNMAFARVPQAWDISVGASNVIVAVVDGGMNLAHPDIQGRLLPGFDFIEDPNTAGDGNGFDDDPTDPGDNAFGQGQHSWHGTHVGGIIAASTDNGQGVAGIMWDGNILPVRSLGLQQSGSDFDILNGILWSVGEDDFQGAPIPPNNNAAKIVNLSLGGPSDPQIQTLWEDIIRIITIDDPDRYGEPIVIAAAGNEGRDANIVTPANIPGVITVGATRFDGEKADYSNFGNDVDVMAPGGQLNLDQDTDGFGDGVLSLFDNAFEFEQGTSFAAPHVSGIVGLMVSIDPSLNQAGAEQLIKQSADAAGICNLGCGTGHVDALATLIAAGGVIQDRPQIAIDASRLIYQPTETQLSLRVLNIGAATLDWQATVNDRQELWTAEPTAGTLPPGAESTVNVTLDRQGNGSASAALVFEGLNDAAGQIAVVDLFFNDVVAPPQNDLAVAEVSALLVDEETGNLEPALTVQTDRSQQFQFRIEGLNPGRYVVVAVGDDNNDGLFDPQTDSFGAWPVASQPEPIDVAENVVVQGVSFGLQRGFAVGDGAVGAGCTNNLDCGFAPDAECIPGPGFPGGYCSRVCDDGFCGAGASCELLDCDGTPCNVCLERCIEGAQCRGGYVCDEFQTCTPDGF